MRYTRAQTAIRLHHLSGVGEARRAIAELLTPLQLTEEKAGAIALAVTEGCTNVMRHGGMRGCLVGRTERHASGHAIHIVILDWGRGMTNVRRFLADGASSLEGPGLGLGTMIRHTDRFDIASEPGRGTVLTLHWHSGSEPLPLGALNVPIASEAVSGDTWEVAVPAEHIVRLMVADGLGHGPLAAAASEAAATCFLDGGHLTLPEVFAKMHQALRPTRGAAVAIAEVDARRQLLSYVGVGNIVGRIVTADATYGLTSTNGTVGAYMSNARCMEHPWKAESLLVMHSDGVASCWEQKPYPAFLAHHPATIAGLLMRDYAREHDDATVCVLRLPDMVTA